MMQLRAYMIEVSITPYVINTYGHGAYYSNETLLTIMLNKARYLIPYMLWTVRIHLFITYN